MFFGIPGLLEDLIKAFRRRGEEKRKKDRWDEKSWGGAQGCLKRVLICFLCFSILVCFSFFPVFIYLYMLIYILFVSGSRISKARSCVGCCADIFFCCLLIEAKGVF